MCTTSVDWASYYIHYSSNAHWSHSIVVLPWSAALGNPSPRRPHVLYRSVDESLRLSST